MAERENYKALTCTMEEREREGGREGGRRKKIEKCMVFNFSFFILQN
jgi:hypothetical protein